ncbi:hypothetical protein [Bacillus cereus]|uniref:hypothetical protein n=1 Tax=Bacillus cereus TaxID=1396 RepID=UPI001C8C3422|nr:hypothetical protein [Bacillus cereus]MBX9158389.1 hypothetical protein [Bacillus cereus]
MRFSTYVSKNEQDVKKIVDLTSFLTDKLNEWINCRKGLRSKVNDVVEVDEIDVENPGKRTVSVTIVRAGITNLDIAHGQLKMLEDLKMQHPDYVFDCGMRRLFHGAGREDSMELWFSGEKREYTGYKGMPVLERMALEELALHEFRKLIACTPLANIEFSMMPRRLVDEMSLIDEVVFEIEATKEETKGLFDWTPVKSTDELMRNNGFLLFNPFGDIDLGSHGDSDRLDFDKITEQVDFRCLPTREIFRYAEMASRNFFAVHQKHLWVQFGGYDGVIKVRVTVKDTDR